MDKINKNKQSVRDNFVYMILIFYLVFIFFVILFRICKEKIILIMFKKMNNKYKETNNDNKL